MVAPLNCCHVNPCRVVTWRRWFSETPRPIARQRGVEDQSLLGDLCVTRLRKRIWVVLMRTHPHPRIKYRAGSSHLPQWRRDSTPPTEEVGKSPEEEKEGDRVSRHSISLRLVAPLFLVAAKPCSGSLGKPVGSSKWKKDVITTSRLMMLSPALWPRHRSDWTDTQLR